MAASGKYPRKVSVNFRKLEVSDSHARRGTALTICLAGVLASVLSLVLSFATRSFFQILLTGRVSTAGHFVQRQDTLLQQG